MVEAAKERSSINLVDINDVILSPPEWGKIVIEYSLKRGNDLDAGAREKGKI